MASSRSNFTIKLHYESGHIDEYPYTTLEEAISRGKRIMQVINKPISPAFENDCKATYFTVVSSLPVYDSRSEK